MKILWIPHTGWHIPQRTHLFCRALVERHTVHVTNWVADFNSWRDYMSPRYPANFFYGRSMDKGIIVHRIPRISPALFSSALRRFNSLVFACFLRRIITSEHIDVVVATFIAPPVDAPRLVFDLFDENVYGWLGNMPSFAAEIAEVEQQYFRIADAVVAASSVLVEKAQQLGAPLPVHLVPNGVDVGRFDEIPEHQLAGKAQAVIGAIGNFDSTDQPERLLAAAELAADYPWRFVVGGRGAALGWAQRTARIRGLSNIDFIGPVSQELLPKTIASFDVGLCPYAKTPMDDARSPMRLLAYAAAGLPTVCTELEEVKRMNFPNVVLVEDSMSAMIDGIKRALRLPRSRPPQMDDYDLRRLVSRYEAVLSGS
jgi:glycosyltransferase involved in cell wall biosynthesis